MEEKEEEEGFGLHGRCANLRVRHSGASIPVSPHILSLTSLVPPWATAGRSLNNFIGVLTGVLRRTLAFSHGPPPPYIPVSISVMGPELLCYVNLAPSEGKPLCVVNVFTSSVDLKHLNDYKYLKLSLHIENHSKHFIYI